MPFKQVDVFTETPFKGNPVAVILDGNSFSTDDMQSIANWTNLSETTFVCKPTKASADYRLRIFTPRMELPFAGHPTLGSAWALLENGLRPKKPGCLVQECGKGLITLQLEDTRIFFELPEPIFIDAEKQKIAAAEALGIREDGILLASIVDVGAVWLALQLRSAEKVLELKPNMAMLSGMAGQTGITAFGFHPDGKVEVRSFAPAAGVPEDPVCGSGNGAVAALIRRHRLVESSSYSALQGRKLGRDGKIAVQFENDRIWVGGSAVTCIDGTMAGVRERETEGKEFAENHIDGKLPLRRR